MARELRLLLRPDFLHRLCFAGDVLELPDEKALELKLEVESGTGRHRFAFAPLRLHLAASLLGAAAALTFGLLSLAPPLQVPAPDLASAAGLARCLAHGRLAN